MCSKVSYELYLKENQFERVSHFCSLDYHLEKALKIDEISGGVILPAKESKNGTQGGIVSKKGDEWHFYEHSSLHRHFGGKYDFNPDEAIIRDEAVVYIGLWNPVWGHCLTDNIKHLWFLSENRYAHLKKLKWVYIATSDFDSSNFLSLLSKIIGTTDLSNIVRCDCLTQYKTIYLPDDCLEYSEREYFYTTNYQRLIESVLASDNYHDPDSPKNIYFSRTKLPVGWHRDTGEKKIEKLFKRLGYTIYYPERMTLDEQLKVLYNCESFATTEGSISHNALFLKNGAHLVCLRKSAYINNYQFSINQMKMLRVTLIDANLTLPSDEPWFKPFFMYVSPQLRAWAKIRHSFFPAFQYLVYLYRFEPKFAHFRRAAKRRLLRLLHPNPSREQQL